MTAGRMRTTDEDTWMDDEQTEKTSNIKMCLFFRLVQQNCDVCVVEYQVEPVQWELVDADVVSSLCSVSDELERSLTTRLVVVVEIVDVQRLETGRKRPQARTR